jgi:hypothetical protein
MNVSGITLSGSSKSKDWKAKWKDAEFLSRVEEIPDLQ